MSTFTTGLSFIVSDETETFAAAVSSTLVYTTPALTRGKVYLRSIDTNTVGKLFTLFIVKPVTFSGSVATTIVSDVSPTGGVIFSDGDGTDAFGIHELMPGDELRVSTTGPTGDIEMKLYVTEESP